MILLEKTMLIPDYHIHTYLCKHAEKHPHQYLQEAKNKGLLEIGFADHIPYFSDGFDPRNRMAEHEFVLYQKIIADLRELNILPIKFGVEADYYPGCELVLKEWLLRQKFDYVLGSVHCISCWMIDDLNQIEKWERADVKTAWKEYFLLVKELVKSKMYDAVAHFDLPKKFNFIPSKDSEVKEMVEPVLDLMAENKMALELNTSGLRWDCAEIYPSEQILELAFEREIAICFGSDAHRAEDVGAGFDKAINLAKKVGYTDCVQFKDRNKYQILLP
jgi:histidinol-phosphatase (PHP family)